MDKIKGIGIKDLIREVHEQLAVSEQEREDEGLSPLFEVAGLDLEVNFVVKEDASAHGGIDLKVFSLGTELIDRSEQVHKIILHLKAVPLEDAFPLDVKRNVGRRPKRIG